MNDDTLGTTTNPAASPKRKTSAKSWMVRFGLLVFLALLALLAGVLAVAIVPREWAQYLGDRIDGRMTVGTLYGLGFGFFCTLIPLVIARQALRGFKLGLRLFILLIAAVLALPNLLTLGIVLGSGDGAHAGERILDVNGPGFRNATASGAVVAGLVFLMLTWWGLLRWNDKRKIRKLRSLQAEIAEKAIDDE
ncbi:hypothetical protein [Nocardioides cavernaquae]|uniref:Permease n=1 Tax=Nocardioides cavernaquae TaxID=2321396 RepID=A0A3A5HFV6_9ACTN|nr:hypothetical protein [Nocardioides cavernaquae]RJS46934.1 hypothetical protein D4739_12380 [Nocardioides cavernaquae]